MDRTDSRCRMARPHFHSEHGHLHAHSHGHAHAHSHGEGVSGQRLALAIGLTLLFVVGEVAAGLVAHSLALLSDAGHNFADALALSFSYFAAWIVRQPASAKWTYGYHRVGIAAALVNAMSLAAIGLFILFEAWQRLHAPEFVAGGLMAGVALVALALNSLISVWLHRAAQHDLNMRSAYLHMLGDTLSSLAVVAAGVVVAMTGSPLADPVVSLAIGVLILWSSWGILTEATDILLEAAPGHLSVAEIEGAIEAVAGVLDCHDLHVWTVASGMVALSCHVRVPEQSVQSGQQVQQEVASMLEQRFAVHHTTIQIEVDDCGPDHRCDEPSGVNSC